MKNNPFHQHRVEGCLQIALAVVYLFGVLYFINLDAASLVASAVGACSLSASAFIVFSSPNGAFSNPKRVLGAYLIGMGSGALFHYFATLGAGWIHFGKPGFAAEIFGALAVGLTMLVMHITDLKHPPAAGMTLGLVFEVWDLWTLTVVMTSALVLVLIRFLLREWLVELV